MKNRYSGFVDEAGRRLWEGDKVLFYIPFLKSWVDGEIVFRDDIPRVSSRYTIEIISSDLCKSIRKKGSKGDKLVFRREKR